MIRHVVLRSPGYSSAGAQSSSSPSSITAIDLAATGVLLAVGRYDGCVSVYTIVSGREGMRAKLLFTLAPSPPSSSSAFSLQLLQAAVTSVAFSPCNRFLAVGTVKGAVSVIDLREGDETTRLDATERQRLQNRFAMLHSHSEHRHAITSMAWARVGLPRLYSACQGGRVYELECAFDDAVSGSSGASGTSSGNSSSNRSSRVSTLLFALAAKTTLVCTLATESVAKIETSAADLPELGGMVNLLVVCGERQTTLFQFPVDEQHPPRMRELSSADSGGGSNIQSHAAPRPSVSSSVSSSCFQNSIDATATATASTGLAVASAIMSVTISAPGPLPLLQVVFLDTDGGEQQSFDLEGTDGGARADAIASASASIGGEWCRHVCSLASNQYKHLLLALSSSNTLHVVNLQQMRAEAIAGSAGTAAGSASGPASAATDVIEGEVLAVSAGSGLVAVMLQRLSSTETVSPDSASDSIEIILLQCLPPSHTTLPLRLLAPSLHRGIACLQRAFRRRKRRREPAAATAPSALALSDFAAAQALGELRMQEGEDVQDLSWLRDGGGTWLDHWVDSACGSDDDGAGGDDGAVKGRASVRLRLRRTRTRAPTACVDIADANALTNGSSADVSATAASTDNKSRCFCGERYTYHVRLPVSKAKGLGLLLATVEPEPSNTSEAATAAAAARATGHGSDAISNKTGGRERESVDEFDNRRPASPLQQDAEPLTLILESLPSDWPDNASATKSGLLVRGFHDLPIQGEGGAGWEASPARICGMIAIGDVLTGIDDIPLTGLGAANSATEGAFAHAALRAILGVGSQAEGDKREEGSERREVLLHFRYGDVPRWMLTSRPALGRSKRAKSPEQARGTASKRAKASAMKISTHFNLLDGDDDSTDQEDESSSDDEGEEEEEGEDKVTTSLSSNDDLPRFLHNITQPVTSAASSLLPLATYGLEVGLAKTSEIGLGLGLGYSHGAGYSNTAIPNPFTNTSANAAAPIASLAFSSSHISGEQALRSAGAFLGIGLDYDNHHQQQQQSLATLAHSQLEDIAVPISISVANDNGTSQSDSDEQRSQLEARHAYPVAAVTRILTSSNLTVNNLLSGSRSMALLAEQVFQAGSGSREAAGHCFSSKRRKKRSKGASLGSISRGAGWSWKLGLGFYRSHIHSFSRLVGGPASRIAHTRVKAASAEAAPPPPVTLLPDTPNSSVWREAGGKAHSDAWLTRAQVRRLRRLVRACMQDQSALGASTFADKAANDSPDATVFNVCAQALLPCSWAGLLPLPLPFDSPTPALISTAVTNLHVSVEWRQAHRLRHAWAVLVLVKLRRPKAVAADKGMSRRGDVDTATKCLTELFKLAGQRRGPQPWGKSIVPDPTFGASAGPGLFPTPTAAAAAFKHNFPPAALTVQLFLLLRLHLHHSANAPALVPLVQAWAELLPSLTCLPAAAVHKIYSLASHTPASSSAQLAADATTSGAVDVAGKRSSSHTGRANGRDSASSFVAKSAMANRSSTAAAASAASKTKPERTSVFDALPAAVLQSLGFLTGTTAEALDCLSLYPQLATLHVLLMTGARFCKGGWGAECLGLPMGIAGVSTDGHCDFRGDRARARARARARWSDVEATNFISQFGAHLIAPPLLLWLNLDHWPLASAALSAFPLPSLDERATSAIARDCLLAIAAPSPAADNTYVSPKQPEVSRGEAILRRCALQSGQQFEIGLRFGLGAVTRVTSTPLVGLAVQRALEDLLLTGLRSQTATVGAELVACAYPSLQPWQVRRLLLGRDEAVSRPLKENDDDDDDDITFAGRAAHRSRPSSDALPRYFLYLTALLRMHPKALAVNEPDTLHDWLHLSLTLQPAPAIDGLDDGSRFSLPDLPSLLPAGLCRSAALECVSVWFDCRPDDEFDCDDELGIAFPAEQCVQAGHIEAALEACRRALARRLVLRPRSPVAEEEDEVGPLRAVLTRCLKHTLATASSTANALSVCALRSLWACVCCACLHDADEAAREGVAVLATLDLALQKGEAGTAKILIEALGPALGGYLSELLLHGGEELVVASV